MLIGEAWGEDEERQREPFVGTSGLELSKMLGEVGIARSELFITNVVNARPPDNKIGLWLTAVKKRARDQGCTNFRDGFYYNDIVATGLEQLEANLTAIKPAVVIVMGNAPLWAMLGVTGITSWRGSIAWSTRYGVKVCPTLHPAYILRQWSERVLVLTDLKRFTKEFAFTEVREPPWHFITRPTYSQVLTLLEILLERCRQGPTRIAVDLETKVGHIACIGLCWSLHDAICIPLMCVENPMGYWPLEQEQRIVVLIRALLSHKNAAIIGQNFLFDSQYLAKHWGFVPKVAIDTMLVQHVCYLGMKKSLDFIASLYCDFYCFWKNEGKDAWDAKTPEEQERGWIYNCKDGVYTYECAEKLEAKTAALGQQWQVDFIMSLYPATLRMMLRGVRYDSTRAPAMAMKCMEHIAERDLSIYKMTGAQINANSPKQCIEYLYNVLQLPKQYKFAKGKRTLTTDDDALKAIAKAEPLASRLCYALSEIRSLKNSISVIMKRRDSDDRVRCSYNLAGTETTRFASSENAFGNGGNLQNITAGGKSEYTGLMLPNIRELYLPDIGYVWVDVDLERADAQVVAWEANDTTLKQIFHEGLDLHTMNARAIWGDHIQADSPKRFLAKIFCHAANYGAQPRKLATELGITRHEADKVHRRWFQVHPAILEWHERVQNDLNTRREVRNAFGFRRLYFDRIDSVFTEALAWIPQSTVAIVINHGLRALDAAGVPLLLQVHDSLDFQLPVRDYQLALELLKPSLLIPIPYDDPLTIPIGFKVSTTSWGAAK